MTCSAEAIELAGWLKSLAVRVVFAESCTAGLVAARLAAVPGISDHLCGSMVTYRAECKQDWLGIARQTIEQHSTVHPLITRQMAIGVLERTATADYSAAVTGHLGPDAPPALDGRIYIAIARRIDGGIVLCHEADFQLVAATRTARQDEAARLVLQTLAHSVRPPARE